MSKIDTAVAKAIEIAQDDTHGYDQIDRWGEYGDYDCSSLMYTVWDYAGVPVKQFGLPMCTGTMYTHFSACGFEDVTSQVNMSDGSGLIKGDVLLNHSDHTAMYIGGGQIVEAQWSENHTAYGYAGDQTGEEIWTRSYYNFPWNCVLRYKDGTPEGKSTDVVYQAMISTGWLSEIVNYNNDNYDGYSGIPGMPVQAFRCKSEFQLEYRVHCLNDSWYNWRTNYEMDTNGDYFAGDGVSTIDGLQIKKPDGAHVHYRAHDPTHGWLDWVTDCNFENSDGYAGWLGYNIDLVQIYLTRE